MNQLDVAAARQLCRPQFRWLSAPTTLVAPVRTVDDLVAWWRERAEQVESLQYWNPAITWLSPEVLILTGEARGDQQRRSRVCLVEGSMQAPFATG